MAITPSSIRSARVAVVGFSKGGGIAMLASARLRRSDITFVFMASCNLRGRFLSIYEASDPLGRSCSAVFARTSKGSVHAERQIATGLKHGAFYQARPEWLEPVRAWIRRNQ